ncbi:MAG TPA: xanthine dehydrogenase family protein molybdopterin-binding subunit [Thermoflexales bacterium]|nr:xanthine dehydrogenase family protein molybdopterin-binding subunit [Thermoflexales bacterium]HQZ23511.1 xanthine dehydrogenase family protein molybdopterin-binding subunit [Thermoflexales bacterium]HRA01113.1 xanthine dehydrogenase family protein molybdopterin-binding subunit [Thermoflexales bacterium]
MTQHATTAPALSIIGTRPIRPDGVDKVIGRAVYGADVQVAGALHGKVLRSPHAHARIVSINTEKAEKLPGVKAVITGKDLPNIADKIASSGEGSQNLRWSSENIIARDKVVYHGHAVAAVAATTANIAEEACALIEVVYEKLPVVLDIPSAMSADAPILHEDLRTSEGGEKGTTRTNVASHEQFSFGNLDEGFAAAAHIVEREYVTGTVHQGYIEPHNATAIWSSDGQIEIWCSTQGHWGVRQEVSEFLQVPIGKIKVRATEIGGGFGGKLNSYLETLAAALSRKAGHKPVKMTMTRAEILMATGPTSASIIRVKMGCDASGKLTAAKIWMAYEAGGFPGSPVGAGMGVIIAPYKIPNLQIDGYDVLVNKPAAKAYRAPGGTNAAFASESAIDELAALCGLDPIKFRMLNAVKEGDRRADGPMYRRVGFVEVLEAAQASAHYTDKVDRDDKGEMADASAKSSIKKGRGVASGFWFNWGGKSSVSAAVNPDGSVSLNEGSPDIGGSRASIAMQFAETLGIAYEKVRPAVVDTDSLGFNDQTGGSRTTYGTGKAVIEAARKVKAAMLERAATHFECAATDVAYERGVFSANGKSISFDGLAARLDNVGGAVFVSASLDAGDGEPAFGTHVVDVAVDTETGKVDILRYTVVQDVGKAIHPSYVEGQLHGGAAQGAGWALNEEYVYDREGHLLNASFLDYRIPTALDMPMIETILVEAPSIDHEFGVRGVGEVPIVPPAGAIANAIHNAIGLRMTELPMNPARVMERMRG